MTTPSPSREFLRLSQCRPCRSRNPRTTGTPLGLLAKSIVGDAGAPWVTLYGEMLGPKVQGNYYKLPRNEVRLFDLRLGSDWAPPSQLLARVGEERLVPILAHNQVLGDWLAGRSLQEASNGQSALAERPREGIVITPMEPGWSDALGGRLILKQRSPAYLAKTEN